MSRPEGSGVDMKKLAHDGVEIFFTQAFRDGFFHATCIPATSLSRLGSVPGGGLRIMGTLTERDQHYIAENFLAFFNATTRAVAETHVRAGWVDSDTAWRIRGRDSRRVRTDFRQAPEGHLLRTLVAAPVPDRAPLQHGGAATARVAAEDAL